MKKNSIFEGVCTALVTPFNRDAVDYAALEKLIERQISAGIPALVICGTTGESATLSDIEHRRVIRYAVACARGRIKIIAGTGSNDTRHAAEMSIYAENAGADALLVVTPYYNKATQNGLIKSYTTIADAVTKPIIIYNVPTRTCVDISPKTLHTLSKNERFAAVKEASPSVTKTIETISLCKSRLDIYSGNDDLFLPLLSVGAKGIISVISNIAPREMIALYDSFACGDIKAAQKLQIKLFPLMHALFSDVNPIPVKYALSCMGLCSPDVRLPLCEASAKTKRRITNELKKLGYI